MEIIAHCEPSSIASELEDDVSPCPFIHRTACQFANQLDHQCYVQDKGTASNTNHHSASVYQYDTLMHFLNDHALYCRCRMPFDSYTSLAAHQLSCKIELDSTEACSPLTFVSAILPQLGFDPDLVQSVKKYEHGFGVHTAKQLSDPTYKPSFLTDRPYFPIPPRRPRIWFIFRDSPPALSKIHYLTEDRLFDMRTYLRICGLGDDTIVVTLHITAQSRTFPFVIHDGARSAVEELLGRADDT